MKKDNIITKSQLEIAKDVAIKAEIGNLTKGTFIAGLSHELRRPLNSIMGMLQLLKNSELSPQQEGYIASASEASECMLSWIKEITKFAFEESNEFALESTSFDLFEACNEVIKAFREEASIKNINLQYEFVANTPTLIKGDILKVQQVLAKLIEMSINFTEQGSVKLVVSYLKNSKSTKNFKFKITDTGKGMSENKIDLLFDFSNKINTKTSIDQKNSLELAVCKKIITLMNGSIKVNSVRGKGNEFSIYLPLTEAEEDTFNEIIDNSVNSENEITTKTIKSYSGIKVLLAEDDLINQSLAVAFLERLGAEVMTANNGKEVIQKFKEASYNIIFMDCNMPIIDGFDATRAIRKIEEGSKNHIPILAMTAYAGRGDKQHCLDAGMDGHIPKPITSDVLENVVTEFFLNG